MAVGTATIDFGSWPGASMASTVVTGQGGILSGSKVEAQIRLEATADHSIEEHLVEKIKVRAGAVVAGTGFTIYAECENSLTYGQYNCDWVWA